MSNMKMSRYENIDGLRTMAAIGIILMHILVNGNYNINSPVIKVISNAGNLVPLFFIISGFGMCCGYYERVKNNQISLDDFFKKRYLKLLPFFALLVIIDIMVSGFAINSIYEGFADLTLLYGFLPSNDIQVIGVGWAMGVIFAFYCLFPFFVFMIWTKKRAWFFLLVTFLMGQLCISYFLVEGIPEGCNIMRWLCFFVTGGLIYLYRENITNIFSKNKIVSLAIVVGISILWWVSPSRIINFNMGNIKNLVIFSVWLCYAVSVKSKLLYNPVTKFLSSISFEIYLAHMMIYRVVEKLGLLHIFQSEVLSYVFVSIVVILGVVVYAIIAKKCIKWCLHKLKLC